MLTCAHSLSLTRTRARAHTHTYTHTHTHKHTAQTAHSLSLTRTHTRARAHTHTRHQLYRGEFGDGPQDHGAARVLDAGEFAKHLHHPLLRLQACGRARAPHTTSASAPQLDGRLGGRPASRLSGGRSGAAGRRARARQQAPARPAVRSAWRPGRPSAGVRSAVLPSVCEPLMARTPTWSTHAQHRKVELRGGPTKKRNAWAIPVDAPSELAPGSVRRPTRCLRAALHFEVCFANLLVAGPCHTALPNRSRSPMRAAACLSRSWRGVAPKAGPVAAPAAHRARPASPLPLPPARRGHDSARAPTFAAWGVTTCAPAAAAAAAESARSHRAGILRAIHASALPAPAGVATCACVSGPARARERACGSFERCVCECVLACQVFDVLVLVSVRAHSLHV